MAVRKILGFWIVLDRRGAGLSLVTWVLMLFADAVVVRYVVASWFWSSNPRWPLLPFTDGGLVVFGLYQFVLCLTWFTHFQAITTDPGSMEGEDCRDPPQDLKDPRRCKLCESRWKPPRAHHCKVCEVCIFKMDHHCPWINNCVGHNNQKLFILFAGYVIISCALSLILLFISAVCWFLSQNSWAEAPPPSGPAVTLSGLAAIECLGTILFVSDFILEQQAAIETNSTLVESHQQTHGELSDYWGHFRQVFGDNWLLWPLPFITAPRPNYSEPAIPNAGISQAQPIDDEDNLGIAGIETEEIRQAIDQMREELRQNGSVQENGALRQRPTRPDDNDTEMES